MQVPYFRPPYVNYSEIETHLREIVDSRVYTKGVFRDRLEEALRERLNVNHAIACASGTAALWIAMRVMRQMYHCKYITMPAFNWGSDKIAAKAAGYRVEYVDIDPDTWLSEHWVPVASPHLTLDTFGSVDTSDCPGDMVVCDATHSLGAKDVGSRGIAECFSMAATKPVTGGGEGGIITTNDRVFAQRCVELRDLCARIPEMSCVVALEYLLHLDDMLAEKKKISDYYRKHLPYKFQEITHDSTHSKICFLCDNSEKLIARADKNGVECRKYYKPLCDMSNANYVYDHIVCLPAWIGVDPQAVVNAIQK